MDSITKMSRTLVVKRMETDSQGEKTEHVVEIRPMYEAVNDLAFSRNQVGCHFNAIGVDISDSEIEQFGRLTHALISTLVCPNCGSIARPRAGDHFRCSCNGIEMRPLERT